MESLKERAHRLHFKSLVVDAHCDTLLDIAYGKRNFNYHSEIGHLDLPRMRIGGIKVQFMAAFIESEYKPERSLKRALQLLDFAHGEIAANPNELTLVTSPQDLIRLQQEHRIGIVLSIEGGEALAEDLGVLRCLHRLGVRSIGLTWNQRNSLADGVGEGPKAGGLSGLGRQVVKEMNKLGMLIDVSHLAEKGFWDVLEESSQPVIASHSNCQAICPHPRNLTDNQIKALAQKGGVMGMNFAPAFIHIEDADLEKLLNHVDHITQLVGPQHVGLGSDFDGIEETPKGLEDVTKLPALTLGLVRRGYSEEDIAAMLGGNFYRVMMEVFNSKGKEVR
ncbi:MAG: dipeptidase [Clostridia bacterium]|nr:dipeptidase [Clostridia bacterium]